MTAPIKQRWFILVIVKKDKLIFTIFITPIKDVKC